jgi:hypothetical protein
VIYSSNPVQLLISEVNARRYPMSTSSSGKVRERDFIAEYFIVRVYRLPPPGAPANAITGLVEDKSGEKRPFHCAEEIGRIVQESLSTWRRSRHD